MRCSQDGEWVMKWNSTERLTLKNKMMNSKYRLQWTILQSEVYFTNLSETRLYKHVRQNTCRYLAFCILR